MAKTIQLDMTPELFAALVPPSGQLFGLDLGTKTIGIAIGDTTWTVASPFHTIRRVKFTPDIAELVRLVELNDIKGLVIGLPLHLDGSESARSQGTRGFIRNMAPLLPLPVMFWDERLSTVAAERALLGNDISRAKRAAIIDQTAAAFILQGALDRMRRLRVVEAADEV